LWRVFLDTRVRDFLGEGFSLDGCANIVTNPPFDRLEAFTRRACSIAPRKVAMIAPTARLNAARWLEDLPLARVWLMTPRPSMGPGRLALEGVKAAGDTKDYCWLVFDSAASDRVPELRWLHKDGGCDPEGAKTTWRNSPGGDAASRRANGAFLLRAM
jgi:hypothetical protein